MSTLALLYAATLDSTVRAIDAGKLACFIRRGKDMGVAVLEIVLYQPEIPPNTGNVMRLCANTGCRLHLVRPLGFTLSDKQLKRAGLDYGSGIELTVHDSWRECREKLGAARLFAVSTRGTQRYDAVRYRPGDAFVYGAETRGLPPEILAEADVVVRVPMVPASRSLNLSNAVAVTMFEAWRQLDFAAGT